MHQALLVPEIIMYIFEHVKMGVHAKRPLSQKALAALATTCKIFYEPAMDLLWSDIDGLLPLLGCITRLQPMIYPTAEEYWFWNIEPLSELERSQFLRHAGRVRNMSVTSHDGFHLLRSFQNGISLFPKLRSLSWMVAETRFLRFFLSPKLLNCCIAVVQPDLARHSIGTCCPALEGLDILTMRTEEEAPQLSETISSCKALVRLQCPPLDLDAWEHLSTVPTLLNLSIYQERHSSPAIYQERYSSPSSSLETHNLSFSTFFNVTTLRFCYATIEAVTELIQYSEFPSLKEFELVDRVLPGAELILLLRALSRCKVCNTLEKITISDDGSHFSNSDDDSDVEEYTGSSFAVTRELHCFTQLRTLRLYARCSINLDNGLLFEAMSSWPQIRSLSLYDAHRRPPKVTFRGFFAALSQCPYLHTLHVEVDVVNIDINPRAESFQHTSLKNMCFYYSPAVNIEAVARIIYAMLPEVQLPDYVETWSDVNAHLKSLKATSSLPGADGK